MDTFKGSVFVKFIYLGAFPPPYGGVTIKNQLLFKSISNYIEIEHSDFSNQNKNLLVRVIGIIKILLTTKHGLVIGISKNSLRLITKILFILNKSIMSKSIVMVMGGTFSQMVKKEMKLQSKMKFYKHIYVETEGMKKDFNSLGLNNVSVFPNCRESPQGLELQISKSNGKLKCLFFSLISKEKGVDIILESVSILENKNINFSIDFYGQIDPEYEKEFENHIKLHEKLSYCGIFKNHDKNNLYNKLNEYDVLLFPTKWKNEGVPGVLVESKIAYLPAIVSNVNFNSEIIETEKTGIVLKKNNAFELVNAIEFLYLNRATLIEMKYNAKASSEKYLIENYIEHVVAKMQNEI